MFDVFPPTPASYVSRIVDPVDDDGRPVIWPVPLGFATVIIIVTAPIPDDGIPFTPATLTVLNVFAVVPPSSTRALAGIGTY
ncbi:hypothetical protein Q7F20_03685 [Curtobacterium sp. A7_M15]|uniref:hypothetical protein n=1 Tax=Curtobacterium sp. A7_M15 TaxID=3065241 RepID=UPI002737E2E1|nr:hypothetical protein [Curtobacterium sp. A7_M15]MDP4332458.1 hypothetical protein [Curtobacterium sp. A7_M15]